MDEKRVNGTQVMTRPIGDGGAVGRRPTADGTLQDDTLPDEEEESRTAWTCAKMLAAQAHRRSVRELVHGRRAGMEAAELLGVAYRTLVLRPMEIGLELTGRLADAPGAAAGAAGGGPRSGEAAGRASVPSWRRAWTRWRRR